MLQYSVLYCNRLQEAKLYRNTKLYCDSGLGTGRWLGAQGARRARRRGAGHAGGTLGAQAGRWARRRQARARGRARQARGRVHGRAVGRAGARTAGNGVQGARGVSSRGAAGARPGRWALGLGAWAGLGLCTRCTRPIFDPF